MGMCKQIILGIPYQVTSRLITVCLIVNLRFKLNNFTFQIFLVSVSEMSTIFRPTTVQLISFYLAWLLEL